MADRNVKMDQLTGCKQNVKTLKCRSCKLEVKAKDEALFVICVSNGTTSRVRDYPGMSMCF